MAVNTTEKTSMAVKKSEFDPSKLHPDYRGWRGQQEYAERVLETATDLIRREKVNGILIAERSENGLFKIIELGKDEDGKYFLTRSTKGKIYDYEVAFRQVMIDGERGRQTAIVSQIPLEPQGAREETLANFINRIEEYKSRPNITGVTGEWDGSGWLAAQDARKNRVLYKLVIERTSGGWVERWSVKSGDKSKVVPTEYNPVRTALGRK